MFFFHHCCFIWFCLGFDCDDTLSQDELVLAHLFLFTVSRYISKSTYFPVPFEVVQRCVTFLLNFSILASTSNKGLESLTTAPWKDGSKHSLGRSELIQLPLRLHATTCNLDFCLSQKSYRTAKLPKYLGEGWQRRLSFIMVIWIGGLMTVA